MTSIDNMSDKGSLGITLMNGDECFCIPPGKGFLSTVFQQKGLGQYVVSFIAVFELVVQRDWAVGGHAITLLVIS